MKFRPGVLYGKEIEAVYADAKEKNYALPAVNVINTSSVNTVLEAAREVASPVIIQFSNGGAAFYAGKGLTNQQQQGAISGGCICGLSYSSFSRKVWCVCDSTHRSCSKKTATLDRWSTGRE